MKMKKTIIIVVCLLAMILAMLLFERFYFFYWDDVLWRTGISRPERSEDLVQEEMMSVGMLEIWRVTPEKIKRVKKLEYVKECSLKMIHGKIVISLETPWFAQETNWVVVKPGRETDIVCLVSTPLIHSRGQGVE